MNKFYGVVYERRTQKTHGIMVFQDKKKAQGCFGIYFDQGFIYELEEEQRSQLEELTMYQFNLFARIEDVDYSLEDVFCDIRFKEIGGKEVVADQLEIINKDYILVF